MVGSCYCLSYFNMPPKKSTTPAVRDDVVNKNIFDILGLGKLPDDQKAQMLQKMLQIIYQRVVARIMDILPEEALRTLKDTIDSQNEDAATVVLKKHGLLSFPELMAEEALFLKFEMDAITVGDAVSS